AEPSTEHTQASGTKDSMERHAVQWSFRHLRTISRGPSQFCGRTVYEATTGCEAVFTWMLTSTSNSGRASLGPMTQRAESHLRASELTSSNKVNSPMRSISRAL